MNGSERASRARGITIVAELLVLWVGPNDADAPAGRAVRASEAGRYASDPIDLNEHSNGRAALTKTGFRPSLKLPTKWFKYYIKATVWFNSSSMNAP